MTADTLSRLAGEYGARVRHGHPHALDAKRDLATERIAAYASKIVAEAPPLTAAQQERIAAILRGGC